MAAWGYEISLLLLEKYFTSEPSERVKYFVSPRGHVISSIFGLLCSLSL